MAPIDVAQSLDRLKSTTIKTNLLDDDGKGGHTAAFSWIDDYDILWRENKNGDRSMKSVTVALSSRLYDAILNNKRILTYDAAYFQLKPGLILYAGILLALTVLSINVLGDALRDALDPRMARKL